MNPRTSFQNLAVPRPHQRPGAADRIEEIENIEPVILGQFPHDADARPALGTLQVAEETDGHAHCFGHCGQRLAALQAQPAEARSDGGLVRGRSRRAMVEQPFPLELISNRRRVQTLCAAQIQGAP